MKKFILITTVLSVFVLLSCRCGKDDLFKVTDNEMITADGISKSYVPAKRITAPPGYHWFAYYDKLQCDLTNRYVLCMRSAFDRRVTTPDDVIEIGMIDLHDNCKWIGLGESRAWGWQQGCQLQFIPGSADEVLWNDREGDRFVCRIMNIKTRKQRTIPWPVYSLSPDGQWAVTLNYSRLETMDPGYGYVGIPDPDANVLTPDNAGIWKVNLQTGEGKLIVSHAQAAAIPNPLDDSFSEAKHYFEQLLVSPDGKRFIFLQRWKYPDAERNKPYNSVGGFGTRMFTASSDGTDLRIIDRYNYTSHFIWRDPSHILAWTRIPEKGDGFFLFEDSPVENIVQVGKGVMTDNGHCTYLPNNEWILNDTYPWANRQRLQKVYLYHAPTNQRFPLADLHSPNEYKAEEWRCDTHPRSNRDGSFVIVDSPNRDGRQMYILDIRGIVNSQK